MAIVSLTPFNIDAQDAPLINGEYEGNAESKRIVIFSHRFGVKRDSWGMFNEIGDLLKDNCIVIRFDYTKLLPTENATYVYACSSQAHMLTGVIAWARSKFNVSEVNIIAHSMGCIITGLANTAGATKIVLLAPPPLPPYKRLHEYFMKREGSNIDEDGVSKVKRSDGSWTLIDKGFWSELKLIDPIKLYTLLSKSSHVYCIKPLEDQVIGPESYENIKQINSINYKEIHGNHDFQNEARSKLINEITRIFEY